MLLSHQQCLKRTYRAQQQQGLLKLLAADCRICGTDVIADFRVK